MYVAQTIVSSVEEMWRVWGRKDWVGLIWERIGWA